MLEQIIILSSALKRQLMRKYHAIETAWRGYYDIDRGLTYERVCLHGSRLKRLHFVLIWPFKWEFIKLYRQIKEYLQLTGAIS